MNYLRLRRAVIAVLFVLLPGVAGLMKVMGQGSAPAGAINGMYSIAEGQLVYFSQGNLQYIGSAGNGDENNTGAYWKFAEHQWDYLGDNGQGSDSKTVDRDLFGWGTSGYNHGATCYQPWSISSTYSDYYAYGNSGYNLFDQSGQADWGYNAISNGGNQENSGWRTLTRDEWDYVFNTRTMVNGGPRYTLGRRVEGVLGVIVYPDNYAGSAVSSDLTSEGWAEYEAAGCVFLPAAGYRSGTSVSYVGSYGNYWSASYNGSYVAYGVYFGGGILDASSNYYRGDGHSVRLVRPAQNSSFTINATPNPAEGGAVSGAGAYAEGAECTLTATASAGYTFVNWTENGEVVSTDPTYLFTVSGDRELVANFVSAGSNVTDGVLNGLFSVGENTTVRFSQGNLQYIGSAGNGDENNNGAYWKFAEHQWDYLGDNGQGSDSKTVDRDLFGWGTSGNNHGATCYQPWSTSNSSSDYYAYGSYNYNLYDQTGQADWGYNAISNGGNQENSGWRTLTRAEWDYVFNTRTTSSGIRYAKATVNGVKGVILLPDDWSADYYTLSSTNTSEVNFGSNNITASQWTTLEQYGAVFLPAAGHRYGTSVYYVGSYGYYWSASYYNGYSAYYVDFYDGGLNASGSSGYRNYGLSVRLVCPVENYSIHATPNPAEGGAVSGAGAYVEGAECTLTATASAGYSFVNWTENGEVVSTDPTYLFTVTGDRELVANFVSAGSNVTDGVLNGLFSVGENTTVCFSQGNLQYIGSAGNGDENNTGAYWKFAEHQWDYLGDNGQGSDSKTVDRDLFGWGTSGYNHGANCYQPWSISDSWSDYYVYESYTYNLYDHTGQADWGSNAISNGGNQENSGWRTLTHDEWNYVFNTRTMMNGGPRYTLGSRVEGVLGVVVYPDNYAGSAVSSDLTAEGWAEYEAAGCVFLPAAGYRNGTSVDGVGSYGNFWSASYNDSYNAYGVFFYGSSLYASSYGDRYYGFSVRLVRSAQNYSFTINATPNPAEGGAVSGAGAYAEGAECTLTATASAGYTFVNWTENGEVVSTDPTYLFTVTGDRTLVANFELYEPFTIDYISDGLIMYLDGIRNVRSGHSSNTDVWEDLVGNYDVAVTNYNSYTWEDNHFMGLGNEGYLNTGKTWQYFNSLNNDITIEIVTYIDCDRTSPEYRGIVGWHSDADGMNVQNDQGWSRMQTLGRLPVSVVDDQIATVSYTLNNGSFLDGIWRTNDNTVSNGVNSNLLVVFGNSFSSQRGWNDSIYCIRMYNRTLTPDEIAYNHSVDVERFGAGSLNSFSITASPTPAEGGTVSGLGNYIAGDNCTLTATPNDGYTFVNWTENGEVVSTDATYSFTVTGDRALVANFKEKSPFLFDENLVAYYPFDGDVNDYSGNGNHGAINGNVVPATDRHGNPNGAYRFPGQEFNYISVPDAEILHISNFTLSAWVYTDADNYGSGFVINKGRDINNGAYSLRIQGIYAQNDYSGQNAAYYEQDLEVNQWHMITGTVEGNQARFYVDGILEAEATLTHPFSYGNSEPLVIGMHYYSGVPSYWTYPFLGVIDEVRIYNRPLSSEEVMQLYHYNEGALSGLFSVSENTAVNFSQGNLQYKASSNTWRFAENQWDCVGSDNTNISESYNGWIDLFGWGTSGYNHGANCYQPWSTSTNSSDYYAYGSDGYNLDDQDGQADWGYNAISNGGNQENSGWHTLTQPEWDYLFNTRSTAGGVRYAKACVNGVNGVILLPDDWQTSYFALNNTNTSYASYSTNAISAEQWATLEQHGAAFLPAAGYRNGTSVYYVGSNGGYWSASNNAGNIAWIVSFDNSGLYTVSSINPFSGFSVRLVRPVQTVSYSINATSNFGGGGTVHGAGAYFGGTTCVLTATPNEGWTFVNWTENGVVVSTDSEYHFLVTREKTLVAHFTRPQYTTLETGWTWYSTFVELSDFNGLATLEEGLGDNGVMIKSQQNGFVMYDLGEWMGALTSMNNESMYLINVNTPCSVVFNGMMADPAQHPITLVPGWNWIGYPSAVAADINTALANLQPHEGDVVKTQEAFSQYSDELGWTGGLNTLTPGDGLMYRSLNNQTMNFVYVTESKNSVLKKNITPEDTHFVPALNAYPYNMSVMAVVELDKQELRDSRYELAAFVGDECRGSVKLHYVKALDRYVAFLTVAGDKAATLRWKLYDTVTDKTYANDDEAVFEADAVMGGVKSPMTMRFNSVTAQTDEWLSSTKIWPNPVKAGETIRIDLPSNSRHATRVEVVNALGVVVNTVTLNDASITLKAPMVPGLYLVRVASEEGECHGFKLIVK